MVKRYKPKFKNETSFGGTKHTIFLSRIRLGKRPANKKYNESSVTYHKNQIKHRKRIKLPVVEKLKSGYRIVDGWHRLKAMKALRIRKSRVEVV